jgi:hypothetical protein
MSDTILAMDYRLADVLNADQLEIDDLIGLNDEVVRIVDIQSEKYGYTLTYENEYGERDTQEISDDEQFELFVLDL